MGIKTKQYPKLAAWVAEIMALPEVANRKLYRSMSFEPTTVDLVMLDLTATGLSQDPAEFLEGLAARVRTAQQQLSSKSGDGVKIHRAMGGNAYVAFRAETDDEALARCKAAFAKIHPELLADHEKIQAELVERRKKLMAEAAQLGLKVVQE